MPISEITLSRIWQEGAFARELRTTDGRRLNVVYGGVWTHANGPDFRGAMVEFDGRLLSGDVELHLRASDWLRHRHGNDPDYDDVILHVVLEDDLDAPVTGATGAFILTVGLEAFLTAPLEVLAQQQFTRELGSLGSRTCLPTLAGGREDLVRAVLRRAGWARMAEKRLRYQQSFERLAPAEVLYRGLLDGMGLMANRHGMAVVAERLPLAALEATCNAHPLAAAAVLLGAAGFLPLSPKHAELAGLAPAQSAEVERLHAELAATQPVTAAVGDVWSLNRVRPMNHPVRRLASLGSLVARCGRDGLLAAIVAGPFDRNDPWRDWLDSARPAIGADRARQMAVNVLAPFVAAYADAIADQELAEQCARIWDRLPGAVDDGVARGALRQIVGHQRFPIRLALENQGLHQIGRNGCAHLRCFECPIASLALEHEPAGDDRLTIVREQ
jgi:hypothetical protein